MSKVLTIPVTSVGSPEPIQATDYCNEIRVIEDPSVSNWPTTAFKVYAPTLSDGPIEVSAGQAFTFRPNRWTQNIAGDIVGYIECLSGSTTFQQVQD
jgi:hypothetical protein